MVDANDIIPKKPSFFSSVMSGIAGYVKGAVAGGVVGVVGGLLVGAVIAGISIATGGAATVSATAILLGTMATSAAIGGTALAAIGSVAGAVTGVVKSREVGQPTAADVVNVAKISFAQGVAVGHNIEHAAHHSKKHQESIKAERAVMTETQISH